MDAKLTTLVISLIFLLLAFALIAKGMAGKKKRDQEYGLLAEVPARYDQAQPLALYEGTYVSTTSYGDWLDRISADSLGDKAAARLFIYDDAVLLERQGAKAVWIPQTELLAVRTESGMAGKFVEKDGLLVMTWNFKGKKVDTGFRTRLAENKAQALADLEKLMG